MFPRLWAISAAISLTKACTVCACAFTQTLKWSLCVCDAGSGMSLLASLDHLLPLLSCGMVRLLATRMKVYVSMTMLLEDACIYLFKQVYLHNETVCCRYNISFMKENWPKRTTIFKKNWVALQLGTPCLASGSDKCFVKSLKFTWVLMLLAH